MPTWRQRASHVKAIKRLIPKPHRERVLRWLDPRKRVEVLMDVVGACNLRCPSCPVGNMGRVNQAGVVDKDLFRRVIAKANEEFHVDQVSLFNWGEPLLHPEVADLIRIVRGFGLRVLVSSNLNVLRNEEELFRAGPDMFRISLSGFTQGVYGQTHARGDIEQVKANMRRLAEAKRKAGNTRTRVHVLFHKYRHNLHELEPMRAFAAELGFKLQDCWAYFMPYERVLELVEGTLPADKQAFVDTQFVLPIREALVEARAFADRPCRLLDEQLVLDLQGNLIPCCTVYDYDAHRLGNYLEMSREDVVRAKSDVPACDKCTKNGLHQYFAYLENEELAARYDQLVKRELARLEAEPARQATS